MTSPTVYYVQHFKYSTNASSPERLIEGRDTYYSFAQKRTKHHFEWVTSFGRSLMRLHGCINLVTSDGYRRRIAPLTREIN